MSGHHHPHHAHSHGHAQTGHDRAFRLGILLNVAFVAIETYFGWQADSLALLADAGHNLSDVLGLLLAWVGIWLGRLPPNARYTYGWQRASIMAALLNALLLLAVMGGMAWEALQRLMSPAAVNGQLMMAVAAAGVLVNGATAWLFLSGGKRDLNMRGAFLHMAGDALVSLGVVLAGGVFLLTGWAWLDPVLSLAIAGLILWSTWDLFCQSLHLSFDGVPASIELVEVRAHLRGLPGVAEVHDLHVWAMSTSETALTVHLVMPGGHPGDAFLHALAATLHDRFEIEHATVQVETGGGAAACRLLNHTD